MELLPVGEVFERSVECTLWWYGYTVTVTAMVCVWKLVRSALCLKLCSCLRLELWTECATQQPPRCH